MGGRIEEEWDAPISAANFETAKSHPQEIEGGFFLGLALLEPVVCILRLIEEVGLVMTFHCQRCGRCCKEIGIPWAELDTRLVAGYLEMDFHDFLDSYGFITNEYSGEIEHAAFGVTPCPFLRWDMEKAVCKIYPVRPWICKGYPGPETRCRKGQKRF